MKPINEILIDLRKPFRPSEVLWKIQSTKKDNTGALVVAYVDARDVFERLNAVCPSQWSDRSTPIILNNELLGVECTLTIRDETTSISRSDVGVGDLEDDRMNAGIKTHYSDAVKRAAVRFGINSCVYELPQIWLKEDELYKSDGKIKGLNKDSRNNLKKRYEEWVHSQVIVERFGNVF